MLQLNPTIPIVRVSDNMKGYAFLIIDYSQEHDLLFTCAMDNGEIWTYSNKDIRMQENITLNRNVKSMQEPINFKVTGISGTINQNYPPSTHLVNMPNPNCLTYTNDDSIKFNS
jgi:hypothetical protein